MTEEQAEEAAARNEEFWLYAGRRVSAKREPIDAWYDNEDGTGETLHYAADKGQGHIVGALYRVQVSRPERSIIMHGRPQFCRGQVASEQQRLEWSVLDLAAHARLSAERRERAAARNGTDPLAEALEPLKALAGKLRSRADRDAFVARVMRELISTW